MIELPNLFNLLLCLLLWRTAYSLQQNAKDAQAVVTRKRSSR